MNRSSIQHKRCAIYTRKSSEEGLEQSFNSLHAQREACEAYIRSQAAEGWVLMDTVYDDGGFSGGTIDRPALKQLLRDIDNGLVDLVMVYKVDRLSRSLADFVRLIEQFDQQNISFVSVTQQFNTASSMGRLTLNVLLSFAQFEREVTSERIRDKIAASKKKGLWMGGAVPLGYDVVNKQLVVNDLEAQQVRQLFEQYLGFGSVKKLKSWADHQGMLSKRRTTQKQRQMGGCAISRGALYTILKNPTYIGKVAHQNELFDGQHQGIMETVLWQEVQAKLSQNRQQQQLKTHCQSPSLLAGILFDDLGNPMSPSHSKKGKKRYRYYVSQALLQFREQDAGSVTRLGGKDIEDIVITQLKALLSNPNQLLNGVNNGTLSATDHQALTKNAGAIAKKWDHQSTEKQITYLKNFIQRITVSRHQVVINLSGAEILTHCLGRNLLGQHQSNVSNPIKLAIPVHLKRCGIETRLIMVNGPAPKTHSSSVKALQTALLKALTWNQELITGKALSASEIAKREKVTSRYVTHILKLAFLSPAIIKSIIQGSLPASFNMEVFKKMDLKYFWDDQEDKLLVW
ncbi:MAG: resolvase [Porticoccus sp.]|nr:resolvase [Porticoccus sp.]|tara:strand:+ start:28502 stop:30217 length:1716 start_codon:yes stop_codon:yes gene_type:complete